MQARSRHLPNLPVSRQREAEHPNFRMARHPGANAKVTGQLLRFAEFTLIPLGR